MRAGIDCVAITDHNTGAWIDRLHKALDEMRDAPPDGYRPLHLFPGVEISVHGGVHLLAIFKMETRKSEVDGLLGAVGINRKKGSSDVQTTSPFARVVEEIMKLGGIAIPAHVDRPKGLFREFKGHTLEEALHCRQVVAMECSDSNGRKPQLYLDNQLRWTEIIGSDSHHPCGNPSQRFPGSHFTWIKMGTPDLEGLKLALFDGPLSIRRSDVHGESPNHHSSMWLESLEVNETKYIGRKESFCIGFNPWLNAIIGGRGTGKSSLLECLRIALRRIDELPGALKPEFEKYVKVYKSRNDSGLLTKQASIRVTFWKSGSRFRIQWSHSGNLTPIEIENAGEWSRADGDISHRFPIRIYSQKQIFHLAAKPRALLRIVDDAPDVDHRSKIALLLKEKNHFLSLRAKIREIEGELQEESRLQGELDDVRRKLVIFEEAGHAEILRAFRHRSSQRRAIEDWEEEWADAGQRLRQIAGNLIPTALQLARLDSVSEADAQLLGSANAVRDRMRGIKQQVDQLANDADIVLANWRNELEQSQWSVEANATAKAFKFLQARLASASLDSPTSYGVLIQNRQFIKQKLKMLASKKREAQILRDQASASLSRLVEIRHHLARARRTFLESILTNNRYVQIRVIPYGATESVESEFRQLIHKDDGSFERDIGAVEGGGLLGDLYQNLGEPEQMEVNLKNMKRKIRGVANGSNTTVTFADQRFAAYLRRLPPEVLDHLDCWIPEDSLDVRYSPKGDGRNFRSIQEGSPGQKTAALLAFLLSYGDEPLVLDQPEDDLDNHLIYELIVKQMREVKQRRQIVVVTHNANIVVNGDAEMIVALSSHEGATHKESEGSLQDKTLRESICTIMEGGRDAFAERYRRITVEEFDARR